MAGLWATPSRDASYDQLTPEMWQGLTQTTPQAPSLWRPVEAPRETQGAFGPIPAYSTDRPFTGFGGREPGLGDRADETLRHYLGPNLWEGLTNAVGLAGSAAKMILPGSGTVQSTEDALRAKEQVGEGKYGAAAVSGASGLLNTALDWIPGGKLAAAAAKPVTAMFLGVGAKTADRVALAKAQEMAAKGVAPEQIWKDTGWFTGADNKWRFEIPDTASKWQTDPKLHSMIAGDKATPIGETFSHPELYAAYPQLREADLNLMARPTGYKGMYQAGSEGSPPTVTLAPGALPSMRSTALHELQHGIQDIEGFAKGGNTIGLRPGTPAWDIYQERLRAMTTPLDRDTYSKVAGFGPEGATEKEYRDYLKVIKKPSATADRMAQEYGVENAYRRQAGEVEARAVQSRADLTPEELRSKFPVASEDVLRENQFVNFKNDPLFSASVRRDPNLWSPISDVKLRKPLAEMEHRYTDIRTPETKIISPEDMVGGHLILTPSDLSLANRTLTHVDNTKLGRPVVAQGGVGFPEANPGMAWASEAPIARKLDNQAARLAETGKPVYIAPMTMSPTGIDASHHVAEPLSQLVQQAPIKRADAKAFNELMQSHIEATRGKRTKEEVPDWVSINSPKFQEYISNLQGGMKTKAYMAEKMGLADWQKRGMPDVAAVRHAMTVPELIDVPRNTSGMAISRYIPGQGLLDTAHRSYSKGVAGTSLGQWPDLVPFDVAAPTIAEGLAKKNAENLAAGKTTAIQPRYHMEKPTAGVPTSQVLDQEWLDRIMKFFEMKGR